MARAPGTRSTIALDTANALAKDKLTPVEEILVLGLVVTRVPLVLLAILTGLNHEDTIIGLLIILLTVTHNF